MSSRTSHAASGKRASLCALGSVPEPTAEIEVTVAELSDEVSEREASLILSDEEMARAARLRFAEHRRRFLRAHIALRNALAARTGIAPYELRFVADANGKPSIRGLAGAPQFNLSHSGDFAAIAVCAAAPVGIDCEVRRRIPNAHELVRRFFADAEIAQLESLSGDALDDAFLRIWTAKEALLKGIGLGLRMPLKAFAVSLAESGSVAMSSVDPEARELLRWSVTAIALDQPILLCVASPAAKRRIAVRAVRREQPVC